jgi:hypothetical protein
MWEVEGTDEFAAWYNGLGDDDRRRVDDAVGRLGEDGPGLARPWVDTLTGARQHNMKELRPRGGFLRILFVFDPRRTAILLLGGDKRDRWEAWYEEALPMAERLYDVYLAELRKEGLL